MGIEKGGGFAQNAFLGEKARNVELVKKIDETAEKVNKVLNPIDDVAKRKVVGDSIKLIRGLGIQVDNVTTLSETLADRNKTQAQKENAEEVLDVLAKGVYVAMRYGENEEIRADLCSGSVEKINDRLPEPLKGLGERVRANIIDEPQIIEILDVLDKKRNRTEKMGKAGEELLKEEIKKALEKFMNLTIDSTKEDQLGMVVEFLGVEAEMLGEGKGEEKNGNSSDLTKLLEVMGGAERSESTYETFVTAEFLQQPIQLQVDTFPPSWFKKKPEWFEGTVSDWQQIIRARINLTNASYIKAEVAALDGEKAKENNYLKLSERELSLIYELPGVRFSMQTIMNDIFAGKARDSGPYFLSLKKDGKWADRLASFRGYQDELRQILKSDQGLSDSDARAAVAMAWNFLYVSNVMESADNDRDISGGSGNVFGEQIRAMMHPLAKAKRKFGVQPDMDTGTKSQGTEEGWGGTVGAWFADMLTWDDTRPRIIRGLQDGTLTPFPNRIGASMIELMEVKTETGKAVSMAQALLEKKGIKFEKTDSNLFGNYCDKWDSFWKYYLYASGKNLLDSRKNGNEWSNGLADVLAKIRGMKVIGNGKKIFEDLDTPNAFGWIMLNSMGIERSPNLMVTVQEGLDYMATVDGVLQKPRLLPDGDRRAEVRKMLHARIFDAVTRAKIKTESLFRTSKRK